MILGCLLENRPHFINLDRMKNFLLLAFALLHNLLCYAIIAYPRQVYVCVDGHNIPIRLYGDEHSKQVEDINGYTIVQNENEEWVYARLDSKGDVCPSIYKLGSETVETEQFLGSIPLHLKGKLLEAENKTSNISANRHSNQPAIGQRRMLIILMEFQDVKFQKNAEDFFRLFNQTNYEDDGAKGSVKDYFYRSSYGQLVLSCDVYGPFQASKKMGDYGGNNNSGRDKDPFSLFEEAIKSVSMETDLGVYDGNDDGYVDNVHIIFAGYGEEAGASSKAIWSHEQTFSSYEIQNVKIDRYSCAPELRGNAGTGISRIGPHCHEIGHALGAMDFYDTDYAEGGQFVGTGDWDLMASGSWNNEGITPADINPYVKAFNYGWIELHSMPEGDIIIPPSDTNKDSYYTIKNGNESYIFENRNPVLYGEGLPGRGMLAFHVHPDIENSGNGINSSNPQLCYIICASSSTGKPSGNPIDYGDINSSGCPFPGESINDSFSAFSTPSAFWWDGSECAISLCNIKMSSGNNLVLTNGSLVQPDLPNAVKSVAYFEGFEGKEQFSYFDSEQVSWERTSNANIWNNFIAYDGEFFLQLSAKRSISDARSVIKFYCPIEKEAVRVQISGYFNSYGLTKSKSNLIRIGCKPVGESQWKYHDIEIAVNNIWTPFSIYLEPKGDIDLSIEGNARSGSSIALDNIKVEQETIGEPTSMQSLNMINSFRSEPEYFSIYGRKQNRQTKGINIIRQKDGTVKKVFVK